MPRRLAPLALMLAGCFADSGNLTFETSAGPGTAATDEPATTSGLPTTGATSSGSGSGATDDTSGGAGTQATTTTGGPATATGTTVETTVETTAPPAICGDGKVEGGEACDDGNGSDDDACLSDCTPANCGDGHANNGESDIDCGGPCSPCSDCRQCGGDGDCSPGLSCVDQACRRWVDVEVDWVTHCGEDSQSWTQGPDLPAGSYRLVALGGGASAFSDPPSYQWSANCQGLDFGTMFTEAGYASAAEAFAALPVTEVTSNYAGGLLRCGILDIFCGDNLGAVSFSVVQACF